MTSFRSRLPVIAPCVLAAVGSCAPTPQLAVPTEVLSYDWSLDAPPPRPGEADSLTGALRSQALAQLIRRAYLASPELLIAGERVRQAQALARAAHASGAPVVSGSLALGDGDGARGIGRQSAALDLSYAPDLSGGRRAGRRAAESRVLAASEEAEADRRRIAADIARIFIQRAALKRRITLIDQSIAKAAEVERIVGIRVREGESSRVELGLQAIRLRQLEAERLRLAGASESSRIALALLIGEEAPRFFDLPAELDALTPSNLPIVSPAEVVARRPDVRAAEARLRAAGGDVDVARAAFLPEITLNAGSAVGAVLSGGTTLTARLLAPIFNRGELSGQLDYVSSQQREAAQGYRAAVLSALADVENALSATAIAQKRMSAAARLGEEARLTAKLARARYLEGEAGLQELLDAQDLMIAADDTGAVAREEALDGVVSLWLAAGLLPAL